MRAYRRSRNYEMHGDDGNWVSLVIETRNGHSDSEIVDWLKETNARNIEVIAPGFIIASARQEQRQGLEEMAHVHASIVKHRRIGRKASYRAMNTPKRN